MSMLRPNFLEKVQRQASNSMPILQPRIYIKNKISSGPWPLIPIIENRGLKAEAVQVILQTCRLPVQYCNGK